MLLAVNYKNTLKQGLSGAVRLTVQLIEIGANYLHTMGFQFAEIQGFK